MSLAAWWRGDVPQTRHVIIIIIILGGEGGKLSLVGGCRSVRRVAF